MRAISIAMAVGALLVGQAAYASCSFIVPCRNLRVSMLNCEVDPNSLDLNKSSIAELEKLIVEYKAKGWIGANWEQQLERKRSNPYRYILIANVKAAQPSYCEAPGVQAEQRALEFQGLLRGREYLWLDAARRELFNSVGRRHFLYSGSTANECSTLMQATVIRAEMNTGWCEWGPHRPWVSSAVPYGFIDSTDVSE
jgi:hypothetical protein